MNNFPNTFEDKMWFVLVGVITIGSILLLMLLVASFKTYSVQAMDTNNTSNFAEVDVPSSPNVVTNAMTMGASGLGNAMDRVATSAGSGFDAVTSTTAEGGKTVAKVLQKGTFVVARGLATGATIAGRGIGKGALFVFSIPVKAVSSISNSSVVSSLIRPSDDMEIPIIDPDSPELAAAINALPPTKVKNKPTNQDGSEPSWPLHGHVTTLFGVPHWPYQRTHSGIDISSYKPSGVMQIKPFRPGVVVKVIHSFSGLGNHVVVDHDNGVTSVYAHLYSIAVNERQEVNKSTVIGLEGSTGASTGTHLHFEIRVNGKAADPHRFIDGQP